MVIDKQGRLFGKLNAVDAAIVFALVAGVVLFGARRFGAVKIGPPEEKPVTLQLLTDAVTPETVANIDKNGQLFLIIGVDSVPLGKITDISSRPAEVRIEHSVTGKVTYAADPRRSQLLLTIKGKGTLTKQIVTISGNTVLVGDKVGLKTQRTRFDAEIVQLKYGE
ncbi:MAG: DUF4330 domain-containing protein [Actinobacteria bacterium]|nr:DUF4330 domain-containing protein [Actinomycetota bacterium]